MSRVALVAALVATLLFISVDLIALRQWKGYDYVHQSMTELAAIGAPTRSWTVLLSIAHDSARLWLHFRPVVGVVGILAGSCVLVRAMSSFLLPSLGIVGLWCVFVGLRMFRIVPGAGERKAFFARTVVAP